MKYVGAPPPGYLDNSNFDTLWSVTFTLSPGPDDYVMSPAERPFGISESSEEA